MAGWSEIAPQANFKLFFLRWIGNNLFLSSAHSLKSMNINFQAELYQTAKQREN